MSLTPIQRDLVETLLGVKPRRKGLHLSTSNEKLDKKIGNALDDYERREAKVLEAVKELEALPATGQIVVDLEQRISLIRRSVLDTGRDVAPKAIEKAYDDLEAIKEEARAAAKLAGANRDFYERLATADRDLHALENHEHHGFIVDPIRTVETRLQEARDAARDGDFGTANARLGTAGEARRAAKETVEQYTRDLNAFDLRATALTDGDLNDVETHEHTDFVADRIDPIKSLLQEARDAAKDGDFVVAGQKLDTAEKDGGTAKETADQYGRDLKAFDAKAEEIAETLTDLDKHPKKDEATTEIGDGNSKVTDARLEAVAGRFPAADLLLEEAKQAHIDGKAKADTAFIADIDAAALDLDTVRNNSDPAMVKAMVPAVGPIDTILQTTRNQVATEIDKADASLKQALQKIAAAKGIRDRAAIDLKHVRDEATAAAAKLKALENHPQKLHAKTEIETATQQLSQVRTDAEEGRIDIAMLLQEQVTDNCTKGRDCADKYAAFLVIYADATKYCNGAKRRLGASTVLNLAINQLAAAKNKANVDRKYAEATVDVNNAMTPIKAQKDDHKADSMKYWVEDPSDISGNSYIEKNYADDVNTLTARLAALVPAKQAKTGGTDASALDITDPDTEAVIAKSLEKINELKAKIEADAEAGRFDEAAAGRILLHKMITSARKLADRREKYNTERTQTLAAIQGLTRFKSLLVGHMMSLNNLVVRADKLATAKAMRFEDACKELEEIRNTCKDLAAVGDAAGAYLEERSKADTALEELEKLKVA